MPRWERGPPYFQPQGAKHEATRLIVRNNTIEGSLCAASFVGVDGAEFISNTVRYPGKWIFRILQETQQPGFAPCRNVVIKDNRITFRRSQVLAVSPSKGLALREFLLHRRIRLLPQAEPDLPISREWRMSLRRFPMIGTDESNANERNGHETRTHTRHRPAGVAGRYAVSLELFDGSRPVEFAL